MDHLINFLCCSVVSIAKFQFEERLALLNIKFKIRVSKYVVNNIKNVWHAYNEGKQSNYLVLSIF